VAPWQVRVAEEYIEANWDQLLTIEALAIVTGASVRTIFHSFKRSCGYTPMDFVKMSVYKTQMLCLPLAPHR
jgi:hypothetical protein